MYSLVRFYKCFPIKDNLSQKGKDGSNEDNGVPVRNTGSCRLDTARRLGPLDCFRKAIASGLYLRTVAIDRAAIQLGTTARNDKHRPDLQSGIGVFKDSIKIVIRGRTASHPRDAGHCDPRLDKKVLRTHDRWSNAQRVSMDTDRILSSRGLYLSTMAIDPLDFPLVTCSSSHGRSCRRKPRTSIPS